jgi:hypothetical protein
MATRSFWRMTPRQSIEAECARRGRDAVIDGCIRLVLGKDVDDALVVAVGGPHGRQLMHGSTRADTYWLRVWGLRGLLWVWDGRALRAVRAGLTDEAWRVREMAAKVVARHLVGDALSDVVRLRRDPVPRVRVAASRAVVRLTAAAT